MIRHWLPTVLVVTSVGLSADPCFAQSKMAKATAAAADMQESTAQQSSSTETDTATAMPTAPNDVVLADAATKQRYLDAMRRYYEYRANGYAYRSRVFEWQLVSSRAIFGVVLTLVGAGMYFAAAQFRVAMRAGRAAATTAEPVAAGPAITLATQLELSTKGVVVNSSVMGVIILALSLAFFYLYLVYVYPIENVF